MIQPAKRPVFGLTAPPRGRMADDEVRGAASSRVAHSANEAVHGRLVPDAGRRRRHDSGLVLERRLAQVAAEDDCLGQSVENARLAVVGGST